jgi:peptide/nickel transport system substrate-binding protein
MHQRRVILCALAASALVAACSGAPAAPASPATSVPAVEATTAPVVEATAAPVEPTAVPATSAPAPAPAAGGEKSVTIGFQQEPSSLSPFFSSQTFAWWASWLINVGVWNYNDTDAIELELLEVAPTVENGGVSADGKTITFKFKKDLKWSDGQPLTSADLKFTWEQILKPENTTITSRDGYDKIESIETPDAQTAVLTFKEVYAPWALLFAYKGLMPMHALKDLKTLDGSDWVISAKISHGPYKVIEVVKGDRIVLEANELYWRGRPKLDKIFIKIVPDRDALLAGLRSGDVDIGPDFVESNIPDLEGLASQLNTNIKPGPAFEHYFFNMGEKWPEGLGAEALDKLCPFKDQKVRLAFNHGIDRFTITDKLLYGKSKVVASMWPNSAFEDTELKPYAYDPEKAKSLLEEAGYKPGADGIREGQCNGKNVRLSYKHSTTTPNQLRADVQTLVQQNLKDIGIEFTPDNKPSDVLFDSFANNGTLSAGAYELGGFTTQLVNGGDPDPADYFKESGIPTKDGEGNNAYRLIDAELDKLSKEQAGIADPVKRTAIIKQMQQIIHEKAYFIPMYARLDIIVTTKRVQNFKMGATSSGFWNSHEWDISQ